MYNSINNKTELSQTNRPNEDFGGILKRLVTPKPSRLSLFAFTRGILGGFLAIKFFAETLAIGQYELARMLHALLVGWDQIAKIMGALIGRVPFIPELSVSVVNTVLFLTSVSLPALVGIWKGMVVSTRDKRNFSRDPIGESIYYVGFYGMCFMIVGGPIVFEGGSLEGLGIMIQNANEIPGIPPIIAIAQAVMVYCLFLGTALIFALYLRSYRVGFFAIIGFLIVVEALYFAPVIGGQMNEFTDSILGPAI